MFNISFGRQSRWLGLAALLAVLMPVISASAESTAVSIGAQCVVNKEENNDPFSFKKLLCASPTSRGITLGGPTSPLTFSDLPICPGGEGIQLEHETFGSFTVTDSNNRARPRKAAKFTFLIEKLNLTTGTRKKVFKAKGKFKKVGGGTGTRQAIITKGIKGGIEKWSKTLMPILLGILVVLVIRGISLDGAMEGIRFLFSPKWGDLDAEGVALALGHSFFTISLGMGTMITYGSYLNKEQDLLRAGMWVVVIDTAIAILAGIAIFTAVFALGQDPAAGPGLIFVVLPTLFPQMPGGEIFAFLFFALLFVAALTSAISISGFPIAQFVYLGFLPRRRAERRRLLVSLVSDPRALVALETPHRIRRALVDISEEFGDRRLAVCRELTKVHEEVFRGTASEALEYYANPRGEFTLVIEGGKSAANMLGDAELQELLKGLREEGLTAKQAVGIIIEEGGLSRREAYRLWLETASDLNSKSGPTRSR